MIDLSRARSLEPTLSARVEPHFLDGMGHMNVAWYVQLFDRGVWTFFERHGLDAEYLRQNNRGMFALEEKVRYLSELREGQALSVYTGVREVRPKTLRLIQSMVDEQAQKVSAQREVTAVHIDLTTRRSTGFSPSVLRELENLPQPDAFADFMSQASALQFAREWVEAWNQRDVERVLAHYADDARFVSPKALLFVGTSELEGKAALRRYWQAGLERIQQLEFRLDEAIWSPASQTLTVVYWASLDKPPVRAVEIMRFRQGLITHGEALYGAPA